MMNHRNLLLLPDRVGRWLGAALSAAMIGLAGFWIDSGQAQDSYHAHVIDLVERQGMLIEMMSKDSVLIALQADAESRLTGLKDSHELYNSVQAGLRHGDIDLRLPPAISPDIRDRLAQVEGLWTIFEGAIRTSLGAGVVGRGEIDTLAELNQPLIEALDSMAAAYQSDETNRQLHSMLGKAISLASHQRFLSQRIAKEYFLIAYRHEERTNRSRLKKSTKLFDKSMKNLLQGDAQQKLIAPPTPEIRGRLEAAEAVWQRMRNLMAPAMTGKAPTEDEILRVAELNMQLLDAVNETLALYMAL